MSADLTQRLIPCVVSCSCTHLFMSFSLCRCAAALPVGGASDHPQAQAWDDPQVPLHQDGYGVYRWGSPEQTAEACQEEDMYWWFSLASHSYISSSFPPNWPITKNNLPLFHYLDMLCVSCCLVRVCVRVCAETSPQDQCLMKKKWWRYITQYEIR